MNVSRIAALFFAMLPLAQAQDYRGRVQGVVTDSSEAAIAGATVTLANVNTGVRAVRQTNETGNYRFDYVDSGMYTVSVEVAGFGTFVQANVQVQSQGDVTVNAILKAGGASGKRHGSREPGGSAVQLHQCEPDDRHQARE